MGGAQGISSAAKLCCVLLRGGHQSLHICPNPPSEHEGEIRLLVKMFSIGSATVANVPQTMQGVNKERNRVGGQAAAHGNSTSHLPLPGT